MTDRASPDALLESWVAAAASPEGASWLAAQVDAVRGGGARPLFTAFSLAPRKLGKARLPLTAQALERASSARKGWDPSGWTVDQAARARLLLAMPSGDPDAYVARLDELFRAADLGELVALYQALPLLAHPEALRKRAAEGLRSNVKGVFSAVAHRSPYPREQLDEGAWNQMVLKALFVGVPLWPIQGLDERANPPLARMLCDYAHERWAAGRQVAPELWRCVGPHADEAGLADLLRALGDRDERSRHAAARALAACPRPEAGQALEERGLDASALPGWRELAGG